MPTVLRHGGFRFYIWPNDHRPPHVHVEYAGETAVIRIESLEIPGPTKMRVADLSRAIALVIEHREMLLEQWRKLHA
jgi:Domain of unknown function (DUF4160)